MSSLITLSRTELEAMGTKEFLLSLQDMPPEAVRRFKSMRKIPDQLAGTLDTYIAQMPKDGPAKATTSPKPRATPQPAQPSKKNSKTKTLKVADDGYVAFPDRFRAWWNGAPADKPNAKPASRVAGIKKSAKRPSQKPDNTIEQRSSEQAQKDWVVKVNDIVWGEGFALPGGANVMLNMAKVSEMKIGDAVADLLPGCPGPAKALFKTFPSPVTCFEEPDEAEVAGDTLTTDPAIRPASIDLSQPDLGERLFDRVFCRESICFAPKREALLRAVATSLRGGGRFVFNDIVALTDADETPSITTWRKAEPAPPVTWTVPEYKVNLVEARLELRGTSDITKSYVGLVEADWRRLMTALETNPLPPEGVDALMKKAHLWQARIAALKSGQLAIVRFHTNLKTIRSLSGPR